MKKRAQSEIITTVLLVLIALAAVAIIAVFIVNQVRTGTTKAEGASACIPIQLQVTKAAALATNITIKRNDNDAVKISALNVMVNGVSKNNSAVVPTFANGVVQIVTGALVAGDSVEVYPVLADGTVCTVPTKATVA